MFVCSAVAQRIAVVLVTNKKGRIVTQELMLNREQVRSIDRMAIEQYGMPGVVLMENAGRGCAELLLQQGVTGRVAICCGKGNNGGDGFVIARHLENAELDVDVLLLCAPEELKGDAAVNLHVLQQAKTRLQSFSLPDDRDSFARQLGAAEWVVDALLGTGTQGTIRDPYATAIDLINAASRSVLAVDLPSGLDCDTGETLGPCVRATLTATFVASKPGFQIGSAMKWTGDVHVIDIGVPRRLLTCFVSKA